MCSASLRCINEVQNWSDRIKQWSPSSVVLCRKKNATELVVETGWNWHASDLLPELRTGHIFSQIGWNTIFLDPGWRMGKRRSIKYKWDRGIGVSTVTLENINNKDCIDLPAGSFENCLLARIKVEGDNPRVCGTRYAWYAPGIGLVKMQIMLDNGTEATMQLTGYDITQESSDYLPLAIGNSWTHGWANIPEEYTAKEFYRVAANQGDLWYLENYGYAYKNQ